MTKIEELEKKVEELSPRELSLFREWFATFDAEIWDRQLDSDVAEGKLDDLADEAKDLGSRFRAEPRAFR
jgi:hypothetical protein